MKLKPLNDNLTHREPAAFRRLCVETISESWPMSSWAPAAFRRLCVETLRTVHKSDRQIPAAFRRLCVETNTPKKLPPLPEASRLQAAVC